MVSCVVYMWWLRSIDLVTVLASRTHASFTSHLATQSVQRNASLDAQHYVFCATERSLVSLLSSQTLMMTKFFLTFATVMGLLHPTLGKWQVPRPFFRFPALQREEGRVQRIFA